MSEITLSLSLSLSLALELIRLDGQPFDAATASQVLTLLDSKGIFPSRLKVSQRPGRLKKTIPPSELPALAAASPNPSELSLAAPNIDDFSGSVVLSAARCSINLFLPAEHLKKTAIGHEKLLTILRAIAALATSFRLDRDTGADVRGVNYPRKRPPRVPLMSAAAGLIDFFDERTAKTDDEKNVIPHLHQTPLPKGAGRYAEGPVLILDWLNGTSLEDTQALRQKLSLRHQWLIQFAGTKTEPNWNAQGDLKHGFIGGVPHQALTLFTPALGIGYKAVHSEEPNDEIEETLQSVAQWIKAKRVDNQTEVSDVFIIADSREAALTLHPKLKAAGIKHIIYPDDAGHFWDPFPEGDWLEDT